MNTVIVELPDSLRNKLGKISYHLQICIISVRLGMKKNDLNAYKFKTFHRPVTQLLDISKRV